jgi:hypothetical protein
MVEMVFILVLVQRMVLVVGAVLLRLVTTGLMLLVVLVVLVQLQPYLAFP